MIRPGQAKGPSVTGGGGVSPGTVITNPQPEDILTFNGTNWINKPISWKEPVISIFDNTIALPSTVVVGDRYIAQDTANGWTRDHIYEATVAGSLTAQWIDKTGIVAGGIVRVFASNGTVLYAGVLGVGVYKSTDNGDTWTLVGKALSGLSNLSVISLYASGTLVFAGTTDGVYASADSGVTWALSSTGLPVGTEVSGIAYDSFNTTYWISSLDDGMFFSATGAAWTPFNTGLPNLECRTVFANASALVFCSGNTLSAGIYRKVGAAWSAMAGIPAGFMIESICETSVALYACGTTDKRIFKSVDNGANWTDTTNDYPALLGNGQIMNIGDDLYVCTYNLEGVCRSVNDGVNWTTFNTGLPNLFVRCVGSAGTEIFAGLYNSSIYRYASSGTSAVWGIDITPQEGYVTIVKTLLDAYLYLNGQWQELQTSWLDPVISIFDNTIALPVAPANGDRYIAQVTANGWTADYIYEWNVSNWVPTPPVTGTMIYNVAMSVPYLYTGAAWMVFNPMTAHAPTHLGIGATDPIILFGTGAPPSPVGYYDGTLYIKYAV